MFYSAGIRYSFKNNKSLKNLASIISVLILSLLPWAEFINSNLNQINEILNDNFYILLLIYFFFIVLIYLISKSVLKYKSDIYYISLTSFSVWIFFQYNLIKIFFNSILEGFYIWHFSSEISLFFIILLILLSIIYLDKFKFLSFYAIIFLFFNLFYLTVSIYPKYELLNVNMSREITKEKIKKNINFNDNPNIYFFLLDAMNPINDFETYYESDLDYFKKHYTKFNYSYYENTLNLYDYTEEVLTSFFSMEEEIFMDKEKLINEENLFPNTASGKDLSILKPNINKWPLIFKKGFEPKLLQELEKFGYEFKWIGNYMTNCSKTNYRYCLEGKKKKYLDVYTLQSFLNKSAIIQIIDKLTKFEFISNLIQFKSLHTDPIFDMNSYIISNKNLIYNSKNPKFYFIHDLQTHDPYLVDFNCNSKRFDGIYNFEGYKNSYLCNIKKIMNVIETIDKFDPTSVVIFQSDHSWIMSKKSERKFGNRKNIFNLIKNNSNCKISPSNNINTSNLGYYILGCLK